MPQIDDMIAALKRPERALRAQAAEAILSLGPAGKKAVPALVAALEDGDVLVKVWALRALGAIGAEARGAVMHLIAALEDEALAVFAATALGHIGPNAKRAAPELAMLAMRTSGAEEELREAAATALWRIEREPTLPVEVLLELLSSGSTPDVRAHAASTLGDITSPSTLPALIDRCRDASPKVRREVAHALGRFGAGALGAVPLLMPMLDDPEDDLVRLHAALALRRIDPRNARGVPVLQSFASKEGVVRIADDGAFRVGAKPEWVRKAAALALALALAT